MNNVNPTALLRSLIVYAVCVPLAITVGYVLTDFNNQSIVFFGVLAGILIFPLLMRWHYPLLVFSWAFPATLFFLPGHPNMFLLMTTASLTISVLERIIDRRNAFLSPGGVQWPLLAFIALIYFTAKMTGGFGLRTMGSDVYGGKKYVTLIIGILSFFALIARPIPRKYANLYLGLYFGGMCFNFISDMYTYTPQPLQGIFLIFPPAIYTSGAGEGSHIELGVTRLGGVASTAGAIIFWMLARHGFRGMFITGKLWRPVTFVIMLALVGMGGFRASIINVFLILGLLFFMERLHRTGVLLAVLLAGTLGAALLVPLASHLPYTIQRSLAFLPLDISTEAQMDADVSTEWRLEIWQALLPQLPKYLLVGRGYSFSQETFNDYMGADATFKRYTDASENPLALASDFHSGPLSLVIPFGIWAILIWLWYWVAGFFVVWRNYRYGDPELRHINRFLFASFVADCFLFCFIFGDVVSDVGHFSGLIGLSIAFNHGVKRRPQAVRTEPEAVQQPAGGHMPLIPRPAFSSVRR